MASTENLDILSRGVAAWNAWRRQNVEVSADLSGPDFRGANLAGARLAGVNLNLADLFHADLQNADLSGAHLSGAELSYANLDSACLVGANLVGAQLGGARLIGANFSGAYMLRAHLAGATVNGAVLDGAHLAGAHVGVAWLWDAHLAGADLFRAYLAGTHLRDADLTGADLTRADLSDADLTGARLTDAKLALANLSGARLLNTDLERADLRGCRVYGVSSWKVGLTGALQSDLVITPEGEHAITVDNLELAQFIYLLLSNEAIRRVVDTVTSKAVLILGRFSPERKVVLDALRNELRQKDYVPILFDFSRPTSRNFTETVTILAGLSRFVIADLTDARSVPQELESFVPHFSVPVQPVIHRSDREWALFRDFSRYHWMLPTWTYDTVEHLLNTLREHVIEPAERKAREMQVSHVSRLGGF